MTRRLILMRHAKSSWSDPKLRDHDRPLNGRGRRSAQALGDWMREEGLIPDQIMCSSSVRTRETCDRLKLDCEPDLMSELYHASASEMLRTLRGAHGTCVLMLGHSPGIGDCAQNLVAHRPSHHRFFDYPSGATLVVDFAIDDWLRLTPGSGQTVKFVIPRELLGAN